VQIDRTIVLVGLMGAGKSSIGRRLAARLAMPFADADDEIEAAASCTIPEIFERFGEAEFRAGERRVIARLLDGPPLVLATGGGAFMDPTTRALIKEKGVSVWLRADLPVLLSRTSRRSDRPLLKNNDPKEVLSRLMNLRYPTYAEADLVVESLDQSPEQTLIAVLAALEGYPACHAAP
jgi:shikimate kinase